MYGQLHILSLERETVSQSVSVRQTDRQYKHYKTWSLICAGQLPLSVEPPWCVSIPSSSPLKSWFPSLRRYHLRAATWLWVGLCAHFPFSVLGFCLAWACSQDSMSVYVHVISGKCYVLATFHHLWLLLESLGCFTHTDSKVPSLKRMPTPLTKHGDHELMPNTHFTPMF